MSVKYNIALPDSLSGDFEDAAKESDVPKSEIMRRALSLYLAARRGQSEGLSVGLVDPKTKQVNSVIVGL